MRQSKPVDIIPFQAAVKRGKAWARLYQAAAEAIPSGERLCEGTFQNLNSGGICASTVVALNLNPVETFFDLGCKVVQTYRYRGVDHYVFELDREQVTSALLRYILDNFSEEERNELRQECDETLAGVVDSLLNFIVRTNDYDGGVEVVGNMIESGLPANHPVRKKSELRRGRIVKNVLLAAAKKAAKGNNA